MAPGGQPVELGESVGFVWCNDRVKNPVPAGRLSVELVCRGLASGGFP